MDTVKTLEAIETKIKFMGELLGKALSKQESDELTDLSIVLNEIYSDIGEVINFEMVRNTLERNMDRS